MPTKTVAICGSHPNTKDFAPFDRPYIDIWVFNEAASLGWVKRCNGVLQMHDPVIWKNPTNRNDPQHYAWLKQKHDFPIWMQDHYPEIPSSVRYPLEAIVKEYLPGLVRGKHKKKQIYFFTSSCSYALALAIAQGYERIELYGIEMETDTEYKYQRDAVFFWIGVAIGHGIEVIVHEESGLFRSLLYGFEGDVSLHKGDFVKRASQLAGLEKQAHEAVEKAKRAQVVAFSKATDDERIKAYFAAVKEQQVALMDYGALQGAKDENARYLSKAEAMDQAAGDHLFSRQEFEQMASRATKAADEAQSRMNGYGAQAANGWKLLQDARKAGKPQDDLNRLSTMYVQAHENYMQAVFQYGKASGVLRENIQFLKLVDELVRAAGGSKSEAVLLEQKGGGSEQVTRMVESVAA